MDPITISIIIGIAMVLTLPSCAKLSKKAYSELDDEKLIKYNVQWSMLYKIAFVSTFITPLPFAFIIFLIQEQETRTFLICFIIICINVQMGTSWFLWELSRITKTEIELRKFNKDT